MTRTRKRPSSNGRPPKPPAIPGEVTLGMAHEIGNLLGALQLRLQVIAQDPVCHQAQGLNFTSIDRILEEANEWVQRVQALALPAPRTLSNGAQGLVDLNQAVAEAIKLAGSGMRLQARRAGFVLRVVQAPGRLPVVRGVPADIRRELVDLLLRAGKAFPRGGTMRVAARRTGNAVIVRVENPGGQLAQVRLGIAPARTGRSRSATA
jgi:signal transduction histidine kinase